MSLVVSGLADLGLGSLKGPIIIGTSTVGAEGPGMAAKAEAGVTTSACYLERWSSRM